MPSRFTIDRPKGVCRRPDSQSVGLFLYARTHYDAEGRESFGRDMSFRRTVTSSDIQ